MIQSKIVSGFLLAALVLAPAAIAQEEKKPDPPPSRAGEETETKRGDGARAAELEGRLRDLAREQREIQRELDRLRPGERRGERGRFRWTPGWPSPGWQTAPWGRSLRFDDRFRDLEENFRDLEETFRELQRRFRDVPPMPGGGSLPGGGATASGTSIAVRQTDDGVRVEIRTRDAQGEESVAVYEAKDAEDFARKHPEVVEKYGIRFGNDGVLRFQFGPRFDPGTDLGAVLRGVPRLTPRTFSSPFGPAPRDRDRLGVLVEPLSRERAEALGLEAADGLVVREVQPDTLAARLAVQPDDVLLTIDGQSVRDVADVTRTLSRLRPDAMVKVKVFRPGEGELALEARKATGLKKIIL